jgi:hypothetical protein
MIDVTHADSQFGQLQHALPTRSLAILSCQPTGQTIPHHQAVPQPLGCFHAAVQHIGLAVLNWQS